MDEESLNKLSGIFDLIHEQNAARLMAAETALEVAKEQRRALLKRPGDEIINSSDTITAVLAQKKWSNSVETQLPILDRKILILEGELEQIHAETRASFTKVNGLEVLALQRAEESRKEAAKRADQSQDMLVGLTWASK